MKMASSTVWDVNSIRKEYLSFFEKKGHKVVPSAPMVLKNDPTLMFTNAGMNQFKDIFLGNKQSEVNRVTDSQKCLRVSGKHNDLEEVGVDTYHHTMFEMLGNWSFGDYFKKETIDWAWELLTEVYKIDKDQLYITVFEGSNEDGTEADVEAENYWKKHVSADRILRCGKKDNFWEMGGSGPCGPCSEIHVDIRSEQDRKKIDGKSLVNEDHPQVIEIWNLVFIEFNRKANKKLEQLPAKHVDTGLGLERIAMVLQGKQSNYETDVFQPLLHKLELLSNIKYGNTDSVVDVAFRVISDHVRALAFSIADGQLPSNTGAGYVIRRILRRAIRYGYSFLNFKRAFIYELIAVLDSQMGDSFPELRAQSDLIAKVIKEEEESFLNTLSKGLSRFAKLAEHTDSISGKDAFELYDTYGFPIDLTSLIAAEKNIKIDITEFENQLSKQKERSKSKNVVSAEDWVLVGEDAKEGEFVGYDSNSTSSIITRFRKISEKGKTLYQIVLNKTPFYPEGGGQVGDKGVLRQEDSIIKVIDTQKENELIVHKVLTLPDNLAGNWDSEIILNDRKLIESNHSATHLLHYALREVLGSHVEQKGSLVNSKHLRFDFSHFQKVTNSELKLIESKVNSIIDKQIELVEFRSIPIDQAKKLGAMSLFGEKYGSQVRMIQFGQSKELCGGTHVKNTGNIGRFKIISESSVAAGIRRIEAITNVAVYDWYENQVTVLDKIRDKMNNPKDALKSLVSIQSENIELKKKIERFELKELSRAKDQIQNSIIKVSEYNVIIAKVSLNTKQVKDLAFQFKNKLNNLLLVIGNVDGDKVGLTVMLSESALSNTNLNAKDIIKIISPIIQGGGGGQEFFATAGGKNSAGVHEALGKAKELILAAL